MSQEATLYPAKGLLPHRHLGYVFRALLFLVGLAAGRLGLMGARRRRISMLNHPLLKQWTGLTVRARRLVICGLMVLGTAPQSALAALVVNIGNGPDLVDGTYLNAQNIADNLVFTSISVQADNEIKYLETVDLGTSSYGIPGFNLANTAPKISILADVTFSNFQSLGLSANQIDLAGRIYGAGGALMNRDYISVSAASVNVLSNHASLQQALDLANVSWTQSTVMAAFGTADSLAFDYDTRMLLSGGLLSGTVAMNNLAARFELDGHDFQLDTGSGFQAMGSGSIGATSGQLKGFLASGNSFSVNFTQGAPGQISVVSSIPIPGTAWLFGIGLLGLVFNRRLHLASLARRSY